MVKIPTAWIQVAESAGLKNDVELIQALGKLADNWAKMAVNLPDLASALALVRAIANGMTDAAVTKTFADIGASDTLATLQGAAARLKALLDSTPGTVVELLEPIGTFDEQRTGTKDTGVVHWKLLDRTASTPSTAASASDKPEYALSLGANAALTIEAGDSWPYSDPLPGPLLRMRADGALKGSADTIIPFSLGNAQVSADAGVACALEYYFAVANPQKIYAVAVGERLGDLPDPFDFDAVWDAFATSDLAGIHYQFDGNTKVNVMVSLADATALGAGLNLDHGASVGVGFRLGGKFFLSFRADPRALDGTPRITAALSRERSTGTDLSMQLGVTIDLAGLAQRVHAILQDALERSDTVLQVLTPYLSPGTWLQNRATGLIEAEATKLLGDEQLRAAVVRDLQGVLGVDTPDQSTLTEWLSHQLAGALDKAQGWAESQSDAAISFVDNLGNQLPAFAEQTIRQKFHDTADALIKRARDDLEAKVKELFKSEADMIGAWLHRAGLISKGAVASADDLLAGVRALIARYQSLFEKVVTEAGNAARAKISAAIQIEESRASTATLEIEGTFLARSSAARSVFDALTHGNFNALLSLFEAGAGSRDFALNQANSSLKRYSQRSGKLGLELVLFGFGVSGSDLLSAQADVLVDGNGQVQVDAKAALDRRFRGLDATQEITLASAFSLVLARQLAQAPPAVDRALGLAVTVSHIDDGLKRHEVEGFVGSLVSANLLPASVQILAGKTFTRWIGNPGSNDKLAAAMCLKLALDRTGLAALLGIDSGTTAPALPDNFGRNIVLAGFDILRQSRVADQQAIDATLAYLIERKFPGSQREDLILDRDRVLNVLKVETSGTRIHHVPEADQPFVDAVTLSFGLRDMIQSLRRIYFSTPQTISDHDPQTWKAGDYRDAEAAAVKSVRGWLQLNNVLFWTDSRVHPHVIAFLKTIIQLANLDVANAFSLTLTRNATNRNGVNISPETVVLCGTGSPQAMSS